MSYEFSSRGAAAVHLVEKDPFHISGIKKILRELEMENVRPIHIDVKTYLKACKIKYDLVFADPPYELKWLRNLPDLVTGAGIIKDDGFFVLEHPRDLSFAAHKQFFEHRNYGGVNFSFFRPLDVIKETGENSSPAEEEKK